MAMPDEGWATALQQDDRAPNVQITKSVGGNSSTYLADYFYINKAGTRIVLRGGRSRSGGNAGPFYVHLPDGAGDSGTAAATFLSPVKRGFGDRKAPTKLTDIDRLQKHKENDYTW